MTAVLRVSDPTIQPLLRAAIHRLLSPLLESNLYTGPATVGHPLLNDRSIQNLQELPWENATLDTPQ